MLGTQTVTSLRSPLALLCVIARGKLPCWRFRYHKNDGVLKNTGSANRRKNASEVSHSAPGITTRSFSASNFPDRPATAALTRLHVNSPLFEHSINWLLGRDEKLPKLIHTQKTHGNLGTALFENTTRIIQGYNQVARKNAQRGLP